jgi:hypothetical protein
VTPQTAQNVILTRLTQAMQAAGDRDWKTVEHLAVLIADLAEKEAAKAGKEKA